MCVIAVGDGLSANLDADPLDTYLTFLGAYGLANVFVACVCLSNRRLTTC